MEFTQLPSEHYPDVYELFTPLDYSLSIKALMEGNNPGFIFVDDVEQPRTAFALTVEGYLLVGDHTNPTINPALGEFLRTRIFSGDVCVDDDEAMSLAVHPTGWETVLPDLIPSHQIEKLARYHYLCHEVHYDWRSALPEGYQVQRVDHALLHNRAVDWDPVGDWYEWEDSWYTEEDFLTKGISFAVLHDNAVVSWCTPDCVAGKQLDVGIFTSPEHRGKGLAAAVTAATVAYAFAHDFEVVGWHCDSDNVGSWKTAEKVGFVRQGEYAYYNYLFDPVAHLAELGFHYFKLGDYARTTATYAQVFEQRPECPDYYYHLAALASAHVGDAEQALTYLNQAVDHGWTGADFTRTQQAFAILHGLPEWYAVLARMKKE